MAIEARARRRRTTDRMLKAALRYARMGWRIFPLDGKRPFRGFKWKELATTDRQTIRQWWQRDYAGANIGAVCDSRTGPIVLDVDGPAGEAVVRSLDLPTTREARTRRGRRHLYFAPDGEPIARRTRLLVDGVKVPLDLLGDGGYVVLPPSVHPETGERYAWTRDVEPAPLPKAVRRLVAPGVEPTSGTAFDLTPKADKLPHVIAEGERDTLLTSLAGSMRRRNASEGAILVALREENATRCSPPLADKQLRKIARSVSRYRPDEVEDKYAQLNRRFAVVQLGGDVCILEEQDDGSVTYLSEAAFNLLLRNQFVDIPMRNPRTGEVNKAASGQAITKPQPAARGWLSWEGRRQYRRVVFEPARQVASDEYNLWRGFAVKPSARGSCERFLRHLREIVCAGNTEHYEWLLGWFAQLFQDPGRKLGTAVALRGPQGVGKSIVGAAIGKLLGTPHYMSVSDPRYVTGNFNSHLEQCLLLQAEEAFWAGDKRAEGRLKDLITNDTQLVERKFREPIVVANHLRFLTTSNETWVVPAAVDERRFAVFDVSTARQQDLPYFEAIVAELEAGGYAKLLHTLLHHRYDERTLRQIPMTEALREQKIRSLSPEDAWLLALLESGEIAAERVKADGSVRVATQALYKQYCAHARQVGFRHRRDLTEFGMWLAKRFPEANGMTRKMYSPDVGKVISRNCRILPPLAQCRVIFSAWLGGHEWPKVKGWMAVDEALIR